MWIDQLVIKTFRGWIVVIEYFCLLGTGPEELGGPVPTLWVVRKTRMATQATASPILWRRYEYVHRI